jgi:hypothetical protein
MGIAAAKQKRDRVSRTIVECSAVLRLEIFFMVRIGRRGELWLCRCAHCKCTPFHTDISNLSNEMCKRNVGTCQRQDRRQGRRKVGFTHIPSKWLVINGVYESAATITRGVLIAARLPTSGSDPIIIAPWKQLKRVQRKNRVRCGREGT